MQKIATKFQELDLSHVEKIQSYSRPPWDQLLSPTIEFLRQHSRQLDKCEASATVHLGVSTQNGLIGVGVKWKNVLCLDTSITLAPLGSVSLQVAELAGIDIMLGHTLKLIERQQYSPPFLTIYTTSRRALQAITQNYVSSGQFLLRQVRNKYHQILQSTGMQIRIVIETHPELDLASRAAYLLAKRASQPNQKPLSQLNFPSLLPLMLRKAQSFLPQPSLKVRFDKAKMGKFTKSIDKTLPDKGHTRLLYRGKTKAEATILSQLRTGISRLNGYLGKIKASPTLVC